MRMDILHQHASSLGVEVLWRDLGSTRRGHYIHDLALIEMNTRLTNIQGLSTLAHEVGHAIHGDRGHHPATEHRADKAGAALIITADEYKAAETLVGPHCGAIAHELGVTPRLVRAWRDWAEKLAKVV